MVTGCLFCLVAAAGIIRLPDTLIRMHAATKAGTLGTGLILAGVAVFFAEVGIVLRALLTLMFLFLTAPVGEHLIARVPTAREYSSSPERAWTTWATTCRT